MKNYMVTARMKGKLCNGFGSRGDLYSVNPVVGQVIMAKDATDAIEKYKKGRAHLTDFRAELIEGDLVDYYKRMSPCN